MHFGRIDAGAKTPNVYAVEVRFLRTPSEGAWTASTPPRLHHPSCVRQRLRSPRFAGFPKGLVEVREQEAPSRGGFPIGGIVAGQAVLLGERGASPTDPVTGMPG